MSVASKVLQLPPYPKSWYVVGLSPDLRPGQIRNLKFCGQEAVLYRTESGQAVLSEAYCPHMGAHLGHGGLIQGEQIVCPFHGFCFDPSGKCTQTGYGTRPPMQAQLKTWPLHEANGLIFAWNDPEGTLPTWQIPELAWTNWSRARFGEYTLHSHPQEIAENGVDIGHFSLVHGYEEVKMLADPHIEGHYWTGKYGMARVDSFVGRGKRNIHIEFQLHQHGLGYAHVDVFTREYGLHSRHFVLATPIAENEMILRIGVAVRLDFKPQQIHPLLGLIPRKVFHYFLMKSYFREYVRDVSADFKVWENKVYIHPPALAQGDGPVILYRKWAEQFYAEPPTAKLRRAADLNPANH